MVCGVVYGVVCCVWCGVWDVVCGVLCVVCGKLSQYYMTGLVSLSTTHYPCYCTDNIVVQRKFEQGAQTYTTITTTQLS